MSPFITIPGLNLLRGGHGSPIWRAIVTVDNCVAVNFISALIVAICFGYVLKKIFFYTPPPEDEFDEVPPPVRITHYLAALVLLITPAFVDVIKHLSPLMVSLVPLALAAAIIAGLNSKEKIETDDPEEMFDQRKYLNLRLAASGVLTAVGVWENFACCVLTVFVMTLAWRDFIRRGRTVTEVSAVWIIGFAIAFAIEGCIIGWENSLKPSWVAMGPRPMIYTITFVLTGVIPCVIIKHYGERKPLMTVWGIVLAMCAAYSLSIGYFKERSASEKFVRTILANLGERKLIIGDGIFDTMVKEFKPDDVRFTTITSMEDREYLANLFDRDESITNKALIVSLCYNLEEVSAAAQELGLVENPNYGNREIEPEANSKDTQEKVIEPLNNALEAVESKYNGIPIAKRKHVLEDLRFAIRRAWANDVHSPKLTAAILSLDILLSDRKDAEADAVNALVLNRHDPEANAMLGSLRLQDGKLNEAEGYLRKAVIGGDVGAMNDLAILLQTTKRNAEAEQWARKAIQHKDDDWRLRITLIEVLAETGRLDEAFKEFEKVEQLVRKQELSPKDRERLDKQRANLSALRLKQNNDKHLDED